MVIFDPKVKTFGHFACASRINDLPFPKVMTESRGEKHGETKDDRQSKIEPVNTDDVMKDLPDPPDWLKEKTARREYLKRLALSDEPALPELDELAPEPDGPDLEP